jgi:hypothetical protein
MSGGGVFTLLTNDGKSDKLIMATDFLNRRIQQIMCARKASGDSDIMPTLKDIEKTHLLFVNAHFKPFCAMGHEYQKVRTTSGTPSLGNTVTFAIPQFGDFFADMAMRVTLSAVSSNLRNKPDVLTPDKDWDGSDITGDDSTLYTLVDPFGNAVVGDQFRNLVRYVEFPGERLCQEVKFDVNGNSLDLYEDVATVMMRKFTLTADKTVGYKRLCGQEVALEGVSGIQRGQVFDNDRLAGTVLTDHTANGPTLQQNQRGTVQDTSDAFLLEALPDNAWTQLPADLTALTAARASASTAAQNGYQSVFRKELRAVDGLQTPKYVQPATDLWCKLRFWFNERIDQAVPSVAIPSGQRYISVKLASQSQLVVEAPGLYHRRVWDSNTSSKNGTDPDTAGFVRNTRTIEYRPVISAGTISTIELSNVELYVNNLFVNPEIHDIYINRIGFSLIRVFRMHKQTVSTPTNDDKQLSQLKWPIEYMFVGLRPVWNGDATNTTMHRDWHRMCKVVDIESREHDKAEVALQQYTATTTLSSGIYATLVAINPDDDCDHGHISRVYSIQQDRYVKELKTFDTLSLTAHGVKIFDTFSEKFFSTYVPYAFGGPNIVTPQDPGCLMFNFALYPGVYQPSGHINVSRAREFYLNWSSAYTTSTCSSELIVVCKAINFLLVANGSCVLRFTT